MFYSRNFVSGEWGSSRVGSSLILKYLTWVESVY